MLRHAGIIIWPARFDKPELEHACSRITFGATDCTGVETGQSAPLTFEREPNPTLSDEASPDADR